VAVWTLRKAASTSEAGQLTLKTAWKLTATSVTAAQIGDFGYSFGYTGYFYTGGFDDTYQELNLGGSYGLVSVWTLRSASTIILVARRWITPTTR